MQRKRDEIEEATMLRDEVPPVKEAIHRAESHDEGGGGHGGSELGWLVSYADMMTLLFGLFVILFSLSQDKTKPVEQTMREVSDKYFRDSGPSQTPPKDEKKPDTTSTPPPPEELQKTVTELKAAMATQQSELQKKIDELKTEAEQTRAENKQLAETKAAAEAAAAAEKQMSEAEKQALQSEKQELEAKVAQSKAEAKTTKATTKADPTLKLKSEIEALKKKVVDSKNEQKEIEQEKVAVETQKKAVDAQKKAIEAQKQSVDSQKQALESQKQSLESQKQALESEKKTLDRKIASVEEKAKIPPVEKPDPLPKLQAEIDSLKKEMAATKAQNEKLQKDASASAGGQKAPQSYMMVLLSWETEKHDLDLQVVDPRKKSFNFKKRQNKNEPGQFELDSRFGPGIEMWKAENFVTGQYRAQISMYAQNGNEAPARARLTVITNLKTYISDPIEIGKKGEMHDLGFDVQADGAVTFKGTSP